MEIELQKINIIPFDNSYRNEAIFLRVQEQHSPPHFSYLSARYCSLVPKLLGTVCLLHYGYSISEYNVTLTMC